MARGDMDRSHRRCPSTDDSIVKELTILYLFRTSYPCKPYRRTIGAILDICYGKAAIFYAHFTRSSGYIDRC